MSWSTVLTPWVVAQKIRAATLNLMVTAIQELQTGSMMELQMSATQSIPNGAFTLISTFNTAPTHSSGSGLTATASGITVATAGRFQVEGSILFAANATGVRAASSGTSAALGTGFSQSPLSAATTANGSFNITQSFNAGDTIAVYAYQTSGAALNASVARINVRRVA